MQVLIEVKNITRDGIWVYLFDFYTIIQVPKEIKSNLVTWRMIGISKVSASFNAKVICKA